MTTWLVAKNNAESALAADISDVATSLTVTTGEGAKFPSTFPFRVSIDSEIIEVGARTTDTLSSLTRAQESTTGAAHSAGATVELCITAGAVTQLQDHEALTTGVHALDKSVRVYNDANISIPNATETTLTFNSQRYDTDTIHDLVTNPSRLTCKTAGKYFIAALTSFAANATGRRWLRLKLNGTTDIDYRNFDATAAGDAAIGASTFYNLAVDDYVEVVVYQNSGGALNVLSVAEVSPEFMMARIA